jgi:hypothetical protein
MTAFTIGIKKIAGHPPGPADQIKMNYRARCSPKGQHLVQAEKQLVSASTKDGYREEDEKSHESGGLGRKTLSYRARVFIGRHVTWIRIASACEDRHLGQHPQW